VDQRLGSEKLALERIAPGCRSVKNFANRLEIVSTIPCPIYGTFIDFKKAFISILREYVWNTARARVIAAVTKTLL
jgi:hypothetical protein